MYQCMDCGNCEKFVGIAFEKGEAIIEKIFCQETGDEQYSWIYIISDKKHRYDYKIKKCFFCNSKNIKIV